DGIPLDMSPDGKWVLCMSHGSPNELRIVPTGAGDTKTIQRGAISDYQQAEFLPDGRRLVILGSEKSRPTRLFVQDLPDGEARPFGPEGVDYLTNATSPDGRVVAAHADGTDRPAFYPLDGGEPRPIAGIGAFNLPLRFSSDGRSLFVLVPDDE